MPEFLQLLPPLQALERFLPQVTHRCLAESLSSAAALGRVSAEEIISPEALPAFPRSSVDGYAVRAADTYGASDSLPVYLSLVGELPMGAAPAHDLQSGECAAIHTGGMLPSGADAVVMLEYTQLARQDEVEVLRPTAFGENVLLAGEELQPGQLVIPAGVRLRPAEIGGLMALGILDLQVRRPPKVGILSSGDEVIPPTQQPSPGQVRDVNAYTLGALVSNAGGEPVQYGICPDRFDNLFEVARQALNACDIVVVTAGSSASTRDLTAQVINTLGQPGVLVHGVNVRPGKPTILGVCAGKAVIGLPGNPVSALVIAGLFLTPVIHQCLALTTSLLRPSVSARLSLNLASQAGREDWVPVRLQALESPPQEDGQSAAGVVRWSAEPVFGRSNFIFNLVQADGLVCIPAAATGLSAGSLVEVTLL